MMGLDMYFKAENFVSGFNHSSDDEKSRFQQIIKAAGTEKLVSSDHPGLFVQTTVAYWRKVNAVHSWFVRELADGVDECQRIYVPTEAMERLIAQCKKALKLYRDSEFTKAEKCMQPQSGFFFGNCEIDEWWAQGLKDTISQLEPLLKVADEFDFYYQASW